MAEDSDEIRMSIGEHLEELRSRVIRCLIYLSLALVVVFIFNDDILGAVLRQPLQALIDLGYERPSIQVIQPVESFVVWLKLALVVAVVIASPFMAVEIWRFIAAGLYPHERKYVEIFGPVSYLLFLGGVAFLYFLVMPTAVKFLLSFGFIDKIPGLDLPGKAMEARPQLGPMVSLYIVMSLIMGLVFQLPLFMLFFMATGILKPGFFKKYRRHFIVGAVAVLAVLSPTGDAPTLIMISLPVVLLYEIGILLGVMLGRKREKAK